MYRLDDDTFDAKIKALLEDAQEEVPAGVWEAVSASVARTGAAERAASRWLWPSLSAAVAAATAVLLSIVPKPEAATAETSFPGLEEGLVAERIVPSSGFGAEIFDVVPASIEVTGRNRIAIAEPMGDGAQESIRAEIEPAPQEEQKKESFKQSVEETSSISSCWEDPFEAMEKEDIARAARSTTRPLMIGAGGNLASNGNNSFPGSTFYATIGAINTPSETTIREKSISTYGVPVSFGLCLTYPLSSRFAVGTGLNYSLLTRSFNGEYIEVDNGVVKPAVSADVTNRIQYIGIPLNIYCSIASRPGFDVYCFAGAEVEKGISNKFTGQSTEKFFVSRKVPGVQFSAAAGLGVQFALSDNLGLYLDPAVHYYFDCDQPKSIRTAKPYMMSFEAGLRFNLH